VLNLTVAVEGKYFCTTIFATKFVNWPQVAVAPLFSARTFLRILLHYERALRRHYSQFPNLCTELQEEESTDAELMSNSG